MRLIVALYVPRAKHIEKLKVTGTRIDSIVEGLDILCIICNSMIDNLDVCWCEKKKVNITMRKYKQQYVTLSHKNSDTWSLKHNSFRSFVKESRAW